MYISIPYMIRFDIQRRGQFALIFLAFLLQFLMPVLSAEQRLGMGTVMWLCCHYLKCNLY